MNSKHRLIVLATVAMVAMMSVPTATAQQQAIQMSVQAPDTPQTQFVMPVTGRATLNLPFVAQFQGGSVQPTSQIPVRVTASADQGWATVTTGTQTVYVPVNEQQSQSGSWTEDIPVSLNIVVSDEAVAYQTATITVNVQPQDQQASTVDATGTSLNFQIKADYYSITSFTGQTLLKGTPSSPVVYPITVVNDGNGDTVYTVNVEGSRDEWAMSFNPPTLTVPPSQTAGENNRQDVTISVLSDQNTQYSNDLGTYTLQVSPKPKNAPTGINYDLSPVSINSIVHIQGVYVPGFDLPVALGALALVGFLFRNRPWE